MKTKNSIPAILFVLIIGLTSCSKECESQDTTCSETPQQMRFVKLTLTGGSLTKKITNVNKLDTAVVHKKVFRLNKNVKNANANNNGR
jgi:hypothetical protein